MNPDRRKDVRKFEPERYRVLRKPVLRKAFEDDEGRINWNEIEFISKKEKKLKNNERRQSRRTDFPDSRDIKRVFKVGLHKNFQTKFIFKGKKRKPIKDKSEENWDSDFEGGVSGNEERQSSGHQQSVDQLPAHYEGKRLAFLLPKKLGFD